MIVLIKCETSNISTRTRSREFVVGGLIEIVSSHLKVFPGSPVSTFSLVVVRRRSLEVFR